MLTPEVPKNQKKPVNVWKWVGIGCGSFFLLLFLGSMGMLFFVMRLFNMSVDPEQAEQIAQDIIGYEIPGGAKGLMSMNTQGIEFAGVTSATTPEAITLMVGRMAGTGQTASPEVQESFLRSLEQQQPNSIRVESTQIQDKQLCGQTVPVTVVQGDHLTNSQGMDTPALTYQAVVTYQQKIIFVSLTTTGDAAKAVADQVFSSLECK